MINHRPLSVAAIIILGFSGAAFSQTPDASQAPDASKAPAAQQPQANIPFVPNRAPGVYTKQGSQIYGPDGSIQFNNGNQTQTQGPEGPGTTYSTYGNYTVGTDGSVAVTHGNRTYENNGNLTETHGNQTYTYGPGGHVQVCSTYGFQTVCR